MNPPIPHASRPGPARRGLLAAWLLAAAASAVLLGVIQLLRGPTDDPDPAYERPGILDLGPLPAPAPAGFQDSPTHMTMLVPPLHNDVIAAAKATAAPAGPGTDGGLMLHLCQAVLTGLVSLMGLSLAWGLAPASELGPPGSGLGTPANRQRAPPTPLRLAYLGVLRL